MVGSNNEAVTFFTGIPTIDLGNPDCSKNLIVKACKEFGFFKVINHGVPMELITNFETEAFKFFSLPQPLKEKSFPPNPLGYGNKKIGSSGDEGLVEYVLVGSKSIPIPSDQKPDNNLKETPEALRSIIGDFVSSVKILAGEILELLAKGLEMEQTNALSKLILDEESDSIFRLNHYPPETNEALMNGQTLIGFGEHTDPQIISVLRSNNIAGLQILLKDGSWATVPPDETSFFIIVGETLQVLSNDRFRSAKHRVITTSRLKSRVSMIYFAGPPLNERISPLPSIMAEGEESLYKEFTWREYKESAFKTKLSVNRLTPFRIMA